MYLATAGERVCLFKTDTYELHRTYLPVCKNEKVVVRDISWSYDGKCFGIVVDGSHSVELYRVKEDITPFEAIRVVDPTSIAFSKHGNGLVGIGSGNGVVHASNYLNGNASKQFNSCCSKITSMDFNLTDSSIAAGTSEGKTHIYGMQSGKKIGLFELRSKKVVSSVKFHTHRKGILGVGCHDGSVTIWDINIGHVEGQYMCHSAPCTGVVFSPVNRTFMASVGFDAAVYCFDIKSKTKILKADIPESGSSIDMHKDGTTVAVGTTRGSVFVYDMRNFRTPLNKFGTQSFINKISYQPFSKGSRKSLVHTCRSSITGKFVLKNESVESPSSSIGDVFSPLSGDGDALSSLSGAPSHLASNNNLAKIESESVIERFAQSYSNEISSRVHPSENITTTYVSTRKGRARKFDNHTNSTLADLWYESPKSTHRFKDSDSGDTSRPNEDCINKNQSEEIYRNTSASTMLSVQSCPQGAISSTCKNTKSLSESNHNKTERLLDISYLNEAKDDEDIDDTSPPDPNLLSYLMPHNTPVNITLDNNVGRPENNYSIKCDVPVQDDVDLNILSSEESKLGSNIKESSAVKLTESPADNDTQVDLDAILNKYSFLNPSKDHQNLSLTFESSIVLDNQDNPGLTEKSEITSTIELPVTTVALDQSSKEALQENSFLDNSCAATQGTLESTSPIKEYIHGIVNDLKVDLQRQNFAMHEYNILAHLKQEMILNRILSHLEKDVADKSVGTDDL